MIVGAFIVGIAVGMMLFGALLVSLAPAEMRHHRVGFDGRD